MPKNTLLQKDIMLPNLPPKFESLEQVHLFLTQMRQALHSITLSGINSGMIVGDNKVGIGINNIAELEDLVD